MILPTKRHVLIVMTWEGITADRDDVRIFLMHRAALHSKELSSISLIQSWNHKPKWQYLFGSWICSFGSRKNWNKKTRFCSSQCQARRPGWNHMKSSRQYGLVWLLTCWHVSGYGAASVSPLSLWKGTQLFLLYYIELQGKAKKQTVYFFEYITFIFI